jgi:hypothetical protein
LTTRSQTEEDAPPFESINLGDQLELERLVWVIAWLYAGVQRMGKAVDNLLDRVSKSLRELLFEDAEGHYFASGLGIASAGSEIEL